MIKAEIKDTPKEEDTLKGRRGRKRKATTQYSTVRYDLVIH